MSNHRTPYSNLELAGFFNEIFVGLKGNLRNIAMHIQVG